MNTCRWIKETQRWCDGEAVDTEAVERHVAECAVCASHAEAIRVMRGGVQAAATREIISDAQFPAFMEGIREHIRPDRPLRRGWRALTSLSATAALVVALIGFFLLTGGPQDVQAVEIELYETELEGATVTSYYSEDGTATVWVTMPEEESS